MRIVAIGVVLVLVAGCASPSGTAAGLTGDERGGKIPYAAGNMPAAMNSVRTHCQQFGMKSFMTQMNVASERRQLVFERHSFDRSRRGDRFGRPQSGTRNKCKLRHYSHRRFAEGIDEN